MITTLRNLILITLLLIGQLAGAGQVTVSPLGLTMTPTQPNATVTLRNGSDKDSFFQIQLRSWSIGDGDYKLKPQQDLVASPPVTMIPANSSQIIRIVRQQPSHSDQELSYRLVISELPDQAEQAQNTVQVLLRMTIPVFVHSEGQEPELTATLHDGHLRIRNTGNAHARISRLSISDGRNRQHLIRDGLAGYVLPGIEKHWPLPSELSPHTPPYVVTFDQDGDQESLLVEAEAP